MPGRVRRAISLSGVPVQAAAPLAHGDWTFDDVRMVAIVQCSGCGSSVRIAMEQLRASRVLFDDDAEINSQDVLFIVAGHTCRLLEDG